MESPPRARRRRLVGARTIRTSLRTLHLLAFAALYGGHVHGVPADRLVSALWATIVTGGALAALEFCRAPIWLVQIRGVATLAKLCLVACVPLLWDHRVLLLTVVAVIGAVTSHMPGRWRYHSLIHGRPVGPQEKG